MKLGITVVGHGEKLNSNTPTDAHILDAILRVMTPGQVLRTAEKIRKVIDQCGGYGRVTIVVNNGAVEFIETADSEDVREGE